MLTLVDTHVRAADETAPLLEVPRLEVAAGERIVVCGPSGAGKSLLLSVLAGRLLDGLTLTGRVTPPASSASASCPSAASRRSIL